MGPKKKKGKGSKAKKETDRKQKEEEEKALREVEEAERLEQEKIKEAERIAREKVERRISVDQLTKTNNVFTNIAELLTEEQKKIKEQDEWRCFMACDGLPDPLSLPQMNTFYNLWKEDYSRDMDAVLNKCSQVIKIIDDMDNSIQGLGQEISSKLGELKQLHECLQAEVLYKLDLATYQILCRAQDYIDASNIISYIKVHLPFTLALWSVLSKSGRVKGTEFKEVHFHFELPPSILQMGCAVRLLKTEFDHYSQHCRTLAPPRVQVPSLSQFAAQEVRKAMKQEAAEEEAQQNRSPSPASAALSVPTSTSSTLTPRTPKKSPRPKSSKRTEAKKTDGKQASQNKPKENKESTKEDDKTEEKEEIKDEVKKPELNEGEVNMRLYRVLGGVFHFNLVRIPPQPKKVAKWVITQVEVPAELHHVTWKADYKPPVAHDAPTQGGAPRRREPEEIERELREQEAELKKLIAVTIEMPEEIQWLEPPIPVRWDAYRNYWSTNGFYDVKYNEETQVLQFRAMIFGVWGLAEKRFGNLPFQNWDLKATGTNTATYSIMGSVIQGTFDIQDDLVCVKQLQGGSQNILPEIYDKMMRPADLIKRLQSHGCNFFPEADTSLYMEGVALKHRATEYWLYRCMAVLANSHQFQWSRYNLLAGEDKLVMQYREKIGNQEPKNAASLLLVTPRKTAILNCTELSQSYSAEEKEIQFAADLYTLVIQEGSSEAVERLKNYNFKFVECTYCILSATRPLTYA